MRKANFPLRLQPSLMTELRAAAEAEGVSVNRYINVAVAEKLARRRTAAAFFAARAERGSAERALAILAGAGRDEPEPEERASGVVLATAEAPGG
jgi:hypothetical protein